MTKLTYEIVGNKLVHINLYIFCTNWQADSGFATDEVSFLSLFISVKLDIGGDGGWWIEERGERSTGYGITEM